MTWMKLDTLVRSNPKLGATVAATGHCDAAWLWLAANMYCRDNLTDGFIADYVLPTLIPAFPPRALTLLPAVLVTAGLWHRADGGYTVHDFLNHNPSKSEVEQKRQAERDRKAAALLAASGGLPRGSRVASAPYAGGRANAHTSPSHSSSPGSALSSEGGPGETAPAIVVEVGPPKTPRGRPGLVHSPGTWGVRHAACVVGFCDFVCLRQSQFDEFVSRVVTGGALESDATVQVTAWAQEVRTRWIGRIPGDDIFAFWKHEWQATHGSNRPVAASSRAQLGALDGVKEALRRG